MNQKLKVLCNLYNYKNKHGRGGRCEPRTEGIVKLKMGGGGGGLKILYN